VQPAPLEPLLRRPRLAPHAARIDAALRRSADPAGASRRACDVLEAAAAADEARLEDALVHHADTIGSILGALCSSAPFFVAVLVRHPDWLAALAADDLAGVRGEGEFRTRLDTALGRGSGDPADTLRRFKYFELARITVRELSPDLVPLDRVGDTLAELSHLADTLLRAALHEAGARVEREHGWSLPWDPTAPRGHLPGLAVLGLGKLGAEELNYSSDVDLVYVFQDLPALVRSDRTSSVEYFSRLCQEFGRVVSAVTPEGFLYRVDLDLRPEGTRGPVVISSEALMTYHESWAATWERAAYMKARPVAGDLSLGWRIIRDLAPMLYRSSMDYESVVAITQLKESVERVRTRRRDAFDLKAGRGGIRDIESVAQALQLLHGGRIPQIRGRGTEATLVSLSQVGLLPSGQAASLLAAYRFLRRTENLVQMVDERQVYRLPRDDGELSRLARSMGFRGDDPTTDFRAALAEHRRHTQGIVARLFQEGGRERIMALFERRALHVLRDPVTARVVAELADRFAREVDGSPNAQRALNNLDRFIEGVGSRRFYYQLLHDRPELVARLVRLFAASEYLSGYFATHPRLIEPIFRDPAVLLHDRAALERGFSTLRDELLAGEREDDAEVELEALRLAHHRELLNIGLLDLDGKISRAAADLALTDLAEVCVERALSVARHHSTRPTAEPAVTADVRFLVVGMGKLASRELTYGSDLDVIFLYDADDDEILLDAQPGVLRLAQKLIWALRTRTADGFCYDIDARLRPSGNQGMLVTTLRAFGRYHESSAQAWERQALLRARAVAGSERLAVAFETLRRQIIRKPLPPDLGAELHRIRLRTEAELGRETGQRRNFKTGRGGMHDVETVVQYLQLRNAAAHEELLDPAPIAEQLERLQRAGLLEDGAARVLADGWAFLQQLSVRLRIVENRSISDLDEERGDLESVARGLGYAAQQRPGGACRALLDDYRRHTEAIRAVYGTVLGIRG
jgi:glutamate-ammonia-ligase adenylyltransferase